MLALLLDEQISPVVAEQIPSRRPDICAVSIHHWRDGALTGAVDAALLQAAADDGLTLVTYDLKTIPPLLVEWGAAGRSHAGVVLVDDRTIAPSGFGRLMRALVFLWERQRGRDWRNRIVFLESS
jgi:hypothetical protein